MDLKYLMLDVLMKFIKKNDKKLGLDISYYGIDISKDMITSAKKDKTSKRINFYHKDIQQLKKKILTLLFLILLFNL